MNMSQKCKYKSNGKEFSLLSIIGLKYLHFRRWEQKWPLWCIILNEDYLNTINISWKIGQKIIECLFFRTLLYCRTTRFI